VTFRLGALLAVGVLSVVACMGAPPSGSVATSASPAASNTAPPVPPAALTVFAASSLKGAVEKAKLAYEAANPGTTLTFSLDSSAALETQIEEGAPVDVFLSADTTNPKKLVDKALVDGRPFTFAGNKLTIIVPTANPAAIESPMDLAKPGVKVIAAGDAVPITKYAIQLVDNLAGQSGYPPDFAARYMANIVSREDNVKAVVAKIELGEGDAGIVYVTDARATTKVTSIDVVPDSANVRATYAGVVLLASRNTVAAQAFLTWLPGPQGQAILGEFGFLPPP